MAVTRIPAAVEVSKLDFSYPPLREHEAAVVFRGLSAKIPAGSRTLLIGANGVGKSTLLRLIAGRHLVARERLAVFGRSPFHEPEPGVALIDGDFPIDVDLRVSELLAYNDTGSDPRRERELLDLLAIDPAWRMCRVSDGQRRRVQLLLALRRPARLLLLDEVTSHLDLVARADLLAWLRRESEKQGLTIIYATHILDGLQAGGWGTHLFFLRHEGPARVTELAKMPELRGKKPKHTLLSRCESWIRKDSKMHPARGLDSLPVHPAKLLGQK